MAGTYLLAMRCPVQKGRESSLGFRAGLENLVGDDKGKGTSGRTVRPKVPTGNRRNSLIATEGGSLQWVARAG